jgi:hypothetical protein
VHPRIKNDNLPGRRTNRGQSGASPMTARSPHAKAEAERSSRPISCLFLIAVESCARYLTSNRAKNVRDTSPWSHSAHYQTEHPVAMAERSSRVSSSASRLSMLPPRFWARIAPPHQAQSYAHSSVLWTPSKLVCEDATQPLLQRGQAPSLCAFLRSSPHDRRCFSSYVRLVRID